MLDEIYQIPEAARRCFDTNRNLSLPLNCPYLGMGSSWFAALALKYCRIPIIPEISSEYFQYLKSGQEGGMAVLISQSGRSSETLWCADYFKSVVAITNDSKSSLAIHPASARVIDLCAGEERYSSTKTYINTLMVLYLGLGFEPLAMIIKLESELPTYEKTGKNWADIIYEAIEKGRWKGAFILGNGPNLATAMQAALILTESTGLPFQAMSLAQFDHGPKESSPGSFIYIISPGNNDTKRADVLSKQIINSGAVVSILNVSGEEFLTPIPAVIPFFFYAHYLSEKLGRKYPFIIGGKVTEVDS
jgi:glucosamine--fructose-6-phosphate aminotransferase (isomerizing)